MTGAKLVGIRPSAAARCPRWAAYQGVGVATPAPRDPSLDGYAERGRQLEDVVVARLRREGRRVRRQVEIPFPAVAPFATGHADVLIASERTIVEIHSNTGAKLFPHKALQVAIYACSRRRTERAYVAAVDPSSLREEWWPIDFEALRPTVDRIADSIRTTLAGGPLPARTCRHPNDEVGHWCPYREPCFADWVWPETSELLLVDDIVEALYDAKADLRDAKRRLDECRTLLAPFVEPGVAHRVGPYRLRRTPRAARTGFRFAEFLASGRVVTDDLAPFVSYGTPYEDWRVDRDPTSTTEPEGDN